MSVLREGNVHAATCGWPPRLDVPDSDDGPRDDCEALFLQDLVESGVLTEREAESWPTRSATRNTSQPDGDGLASERAQRDAAYQMVVSWGKSLLALFAVFVAAVVLPVVLPGPAGPAAGSMAMGIAFFAWWILRQGPSLDADERRRAWWFYLLLAGAMGPLFWAMARFQVEGLWFWGVLLAATAVAWIAGRAFQVPRLE